MLAFYCFFLHFETFYSWNNQFLIVYTNLIVKIYNISTLYSGYFIYHFIFIYKYILFVIMLFILFLPIFHLFLSIFHF